jgi:hypothetical protein
MPLKQGEHTGWAVAHPKICEKNSTPNLRNIVYIYYLFEKKNLNWGARFFKGAPTLLLFSESATHWKGDNAVMLVEP